MTLEALAEKYGVAYQQVRRDLGEADCPGGQTDPPARVTGKDGKQYPSRKPRKPKAETPAVAANTVAQNDGKACRVFPIRQICLNGETPGNRPCRPFRSRNPGIYHPSHWMPDSRPSMVQMLGSRHQTWFRCWNSSIYHASRWMWESPSPMVQMWESAHQTPAILGGGKFATTERCHLCRIFRVGFSRFGPPRF